MGASITEVFLTNGHDVTMIDVKQEFLDRGVKTITNDLSFLVKKEKMTEEHKNELLGALKTSLDRKAAADADFVMEVILERMDRKNDLLQELDEICQPHGIVGANTAAMYPTVLAPTVQRAETVIGGH